MAKQLRGEGRRDDAKFVAALRRPTPSAWALNTVARAQPALVAQALQSGRALQAASDSAVRGERTGVREAGASARETSDAVVRAAVGALGARGATHALTIAATLRAAVLDEEIGAALEAGTLSDDHDASGFGFSAGLEPPSDDATLAARARDADKARDRRRAELVAEAERLESQAQLAEEVAARARAAADAARRAADELG